MSVTVQQELNIRVDDGVQPPGSHTLSAGRILPSNFNIAVQSGAANGGWEYRELTAAIPNPMSLVPSGSGVGFVMDVFERATGAAEGSSSGVFDMRLTSREEVSGTLVLSTEVYPSGGDPGFGMFTLDVGADGIIELGAPPSLEGGIQREQRVQVGPQGLVVRIDHQGSLRTGTIGVGEYRTRMHLMFLPQAYRIEQGDPGCTQAEVWRETNGNVRLRALGSLFARPQVAVLLLGSQLTTGVAPFSPGCPLHVDWFVAEVRFLPAGFVPIHLPVATLPTGFDLHAQVAWFDPMGEQVLTSQRLDLVAN